MKKHINARESWERFDGEKFTDMLNVKIYFVNVIIFAEYIDLLIIISLRLIYHYIKDKVFFSLQLVSMFALSNMELHQVVKIMSISIIVFGKPDFKYSL